MHLWVYETLFYNCFEMASVNVCISVCVLKKVTTGDRQVAINGRTRHNLVYYICKTFIGVLFLLLNIH